MGMYIVFEVLGIYCYFVLGHLEIHAWQKSLGNQKLRHLSTHGKKSLGNQNLRHLEIHAWQKSVGNKKLRHLEIHPWQNKSRELKIGALRNPHRANKKSRELNKQAPGCAGAVTLTQLETPQGATGEAPITDHHGSSVFWTFSSTMSN